MPVIRIDDEVWEGLQKRAAPLVDTPNSVLRKLLELGEVEADASGGSEAEFKERTIEIALNNISTPRKYALIPIPKSKRWFFPGYKVYFNLETDIGTIETRVTSAPKGTPDGDPDGGAYIQGNLRHWYEQHPDLKPGEKIRFEVIKTGKRYRLSTH